ncbi:hypothetical protein WG68_13520 [Arsukibacterium ikkense]|uniref:Uncharacterized protein n=2 Tax=Arsukibacterium ikkense TaxID=336831 RepID=A0A0M2V2Q6_9GAMM|nr:hypothetical protein WG68_13520 [Arsukibacterium ikkense]
MLLFSLSAQADAPASQPFEQFFQQLSKQCGNAYPGKLTLEPEGDDMLTGTELLIVHFRECSDTQLKLPFHIELEASQSWNRSRTWIITKHPEQLELRHDHRTQQGDDDKVTMYGGFSVGAGTVIRQQFQSLERTAESGYFRGWRIEIEPGVRYTYGTVRGEEWSWRIDFDLSQPLAELPPAPWGHQ